MPTPRQQILEQLRERRAQQTSSEGRAPIADQGQLEKAATGFVRQATAPLDILGLAIEPPYGPSGPGVAGTVGELVGSIAPYAAAEAALAKIPALAERGFLPSVARSAGSFGLVDFGRAPGPDETRTGAAVKGALMGAVIGASMAPSIDPITGRVLSEASIPKVMLGGAASSVIPLAFGDQPNAPVQLTGNQAVDAAIFNAATAGALQGLNKWMASRGIQAPPREEPAAPPLPPPAPITDPRRLLNPRTFRQPPSSLEPLIPGTPPTSEPAAPAAALLQSIVAPEAPVPPPITEVGGGPVRLTPERRASIIAREQEAQLGRRVDDELQLANIRRRGIVDDTARMWIADRQAKGIPLSDAHVGMPDELLKAYPELPRAVQNEVKRMAAPEQLSLPGGAPDLMPMQPGPALPFVPPSPLEQQLNKAGIKTQQTIPFRVTENLDPIAGNDSAEWEGVINGPATLVRGMSKEELKNSLRRGSLASNRLLEDVGHERATPEMRAAGAPDQPITWASAEPRVASSFGDYFVVFEAEGFKAHSSHAPKSGRLTREFDLNDEPASVAIYGEIPWDRVKFVGQWSRDRKSFTPVPLTDEFALPRVVEQSTTLIHGAKGPLVQIIRSTEEQTALSAKAADLRSGARIKKGRLIDIDPADAGYFEGLPGFQDGKINTSGLGQDDIDQIIAKATAIDNSDLVETLERSKAGLAKKGSTAKAVPDKGKLAGIAAEYDGLIADAKNKGDQKLVKQLVTAKRRILAGGYRPGQETVKMAGEEVLIHEASGVISPEEMLIAKDEAASIGAVVDVAERASIEQELGTTLGRQANRQSHEFAKALDHVRQAESGAVMSYSNMVRAMKDMRTPIVGVEGDKFKVAMPNETIVSMSKDEITARIQASLPPTDAVPVFTGPDTPPQAAPIDLSKAEQLALPGVTKELGLPPLSAEQMITEALSPYGTGALRQSVEKLRPVPEPSEAVVLKAAEREAPSIVATPLSASAQEAVDRAEQIKSAKLVQLPGKTTRGELTTKSINEFNKARGIEAVTQRLPKRHKAAYVKGEAAAKAMEVDQAPDGIVVTDKVTGKKSRVKTPEEAAKVIADSPNNEGPMRTEGELRSFFRRRFAGAKGAAERNNIRKKYALYSAYFPRMGEPLNPGEAPLTTLDGMVNRRVPPVVDLTPPEAGGGGRMNLPPEQSPTPPTGMPMIGDGVEWKALFSSAFERWATPMKQFTMDIANRTKFAIDPYEKVFVPLHDGQNLFMAARDKYMDRFIKAFRVAPTAEAAERITNYMEASDKVKAAQEFGLSKTEIGVADRLRSMYDELFKELGLEGQVPYVQNYVTWRRLHSDLDGKVALDTYHRAFAKQRSYFILQELERETDGLWTREKNAYKLFHEYLYRGLRKQHLAEPHAAAVNWINELSKQTPSDYKPIIDQLATFTNDIWTNTEMSRKALNTFYRGALGKLGVPMAENMRDDFITILQQLNTSSMMGLRAPLALRNSIQIFFGYPLFGEKWFAHGLQQAMTKEGYAEARRIFNIVGGPSVPGGDEIFNVLSPLGRLNRWMMQAYSKVDDFTRVSTYHSAKGKFLDAALRAREQGWNLDRFIKEAELDSIYHPAEARFLAKMYQGGNIPAAAERAGYLAQQNTNFIYGSGNNPASMRGVAGRLFGQFGVWPASYVQYARYVAQFGTPSQRAGKITRFLAMNTAFGAAGTLLGINTWKWLMFGPVAFTGGPIFQTALDAAKVASNFAQQRRDTESDLAAARLKQNVPSMFIPGHSFLRDVEGTVNESQNGVKPMLIRALTGQSPEASQSLTLPPRAQRQAILEAIRRRRSTGQ